MPRPSGFIAWDAEYLVILSILERTPADQAKALSRRPGIQEIVPPPADQAKALSRRPGIQEIVPQQTRQRPSHGVRESSNRSGFSKLMFC